MVIGTAASGRPASCDDVVGMFVNTLVLRTDVDPASTVDDLIATGGTARAAAQLLRARYAQSPSLDLLDALVALNTTPTEGQGDRRSDNNSGGKTS